MAVIIAVVVVFALVYFEVWHERRTSKHLYDFFLRKKKD